MQRKGNTCALLVGILIGAATMGNSIAVLQNIKNRPTIWSSNSTSGYLSTENENTNWKRSMHPHAPDTIIYNSQDMETIYGSVSGWMNKENVYRYKIYGLWKSEVAQSCPTLCDPMDCSPPGSFVHGAFQARNLEWVAISFSRGSFWPRDQTQVSCIVGRHFTIWATKEVHMKYT